MLSRTTAISHHNLREPMCFLCIGVLKTEVATLGTFVMVILANHPVALATLACAALFATAASKALAHSFVVKKLMQTPEKVAG